MQEKAKHNMAKVAKTQRKKKKKSIISLDNRKKIVRAYYTLYRAFLVKNLLSGMTLGAASHNALQLVRAKIATMDKTNPVTKYLLRINKRHTRRMAKRIMTSKYRDARAVAKPDVRAKLTQKIPQWVKSALNTFSTVSALYKQKQPVMQTQKHVPVLQMLLIQQKQRQRAA